MFLSFRMRIEVRVASRARIGVAAMIGQEAGRGNGDDARR
jgi:hypothetical protein